MNLQKIKSNCIQILIPIIGILIIISWMFLIVPDLKNDFLAFEDLREYVGTDAYVESVGGELSTTDNTKDLLEYNIVNVDGNIFEIESTYTTFDQITSEKIYENTNTYFVDQKTRKHVGNEDWYFIFPFNVQKQNYQLIDPNMEVPATFVFEETKYIDDLEVYVFSCETFGDDFSDGFPEFAPTKIFGDQTCKTSIEPITGKTVEFAITWDIYSIQDDSHLPIEVGGTETTIFTEHILLQSARETKNLFSIYDFIIPTFMILILGAVFAASVYNKKSKGKDVLQQTNAILERMSVIGELTSRLVHDLKNPLGVINMTTQMMKMETSDEKSLSRIKKIDESYDSIIIQIEDVLDYIKEGKFIFRETSLSGIISKAIKMTGIPDSVKLNQDLKEITISADGLKLQVVFSNLLKNAVEAMNGKGEINIRLVDMEDKVKIEFDDSGPGIPPKVLGEIFNPTFTTKSTGTGLGLVSCKKIVEQHNGEIKIKNNPTTFTVILPKGSMETK